MYLASGKSIIISTFLVFSFVACGGGDSGSNDSSKTTSSDMNVTNTITTKIQDTKSDIVTYKDLFSMTNTYPNKTGLILDAHGVQGLKLACGDKEILSEQNGLFLCNSFPLSIYIGNFKLGELSSIAKDKLIYTQDILHIPRAATMHPNITKLSIILQSLDEDADLENGINITQESIDILNSDLSNFTNISQLTIEDITNIINNVIENRKINNPDTKLVKVTIKQAQNNLTQALANAPVTEIDTMSFTSISK